MIEPSFFYELLKSHGTDFFAGVPDSLLKSFCAYVTDNAPEENHVIAVNEGCATALASGHYFATGNIPLVYMQNSGEGNAVNPLLSLADSDVYGVPVLLLIGWRGEPGVHDEPQHVKQGKVTCPLLETMRIPYEVLPDDGAECARAVSHAYTYLKENCAPYALVVRKGLFADYKLKNNIPVQAQMKREEAIALVASAAPKNAVFVSTTGMASRELYELRDRKGESHESDFLTVGSMGHASQIALAIAMRKKGRPVFCMDGDGAALMHMGGMATIGTRSPANLVHIVLNNGAHDSVGGQPTVGLRVDLPAVARACGYREVHSVATEAELSDALSKICGAIQNGTPALTFLEVKVAKGARADLGRPKTTPEENKRAFMAFLNKEF